MITHTKTHTNIEYLYYYITDYFRLYKPNMYGTKAEICYNIETKKWQVILSRNEFPNTC